MKNVLYISYDGLTDPLGQSQILPYLQLLTRHGYSFTILSFEKADRFEREKGVVQAIVDEAGINWYPLSFTARPPVLSKIWDRYRMQKKAVQLHTLIGFSIVHCRSYVAAEMGLQLKKRFGIKMIFDMRGFWADEKIDNGQWNIEKPLYKRIYRHYKKAEKEFLLGADGIVSLTEAAKAYLLGQAQYKHLIITVIPTCADLEHFNYHNIPVQQTQSLKQKLGFSSNDKIITYLGSVGGWYLTAAMFRFFLQLRLQHPEYKMLLLTKDNSEKVHSEAAALGVPPNALVITYSDRKSLPQYLSLSACSVFFIKDSFSKKASSPTKLAELMGMGIPVICNDIGDTGNIINATGAGIVINRFDEVTLQTAVQKISQLEEFGKEKIRQSAKQHFDLETGAAKYLALYKSITA